MCHPECIIYLEKLGIRKAHECWICEYAQKFDLVKVADIVTHQKQKVDKPSATKVRVEKKITKAPLFEEPHRGDPEYIFSNEYPAFLPPPKSSDLAVSQSDTVCKPHTHEPQWEVCDSSDDPDTQFVNEDERQRKVVSDIRAIVDDSLSQDDLKSMLMQTLYMKRYNIIWSALQARVTIVWRESVKNRMRNVGMRPS